MSTRSDVNFYVGAFGPTIDIVVRSPIVMERILATLQSLADQQANDIDLERMLTENADYGDLKLNMRCVWDGPASPGKTLFWEAEQHAFHWIDDPDGWSDRVELVRSLLESRAGHQYLTTEGLDDALVVLSYGT